MIAMTAGARGSSRISCASTSSRQSSSNNRRDAASNNGAVISSNGSIEDNIRFGTSRGADDLGSTDEVRVFDDEDEKEGTAESAAENLREDKADLVVEGEKQSSLWKPYEGLSFSGPSMMMPSLYPSGLHHIMHSNQQSLLSSHQAAANAFFFSRPNSYGATSAASHLFHAAASTGRFSPYLHPLLSATVASSLSPSQHFNTTGFTSNTLHDRHSPSSSIAADVNSSISASNGVMTSGLTVGAISTSLPTSFPTSSRAMPLSALQNVSNSNGMHHHGTCNTPCALSTTSGAGTAAHRLRSVHSGPSSMSVVANSLTTSHVSPGEGCGQAIATGINFNQGSHPPSGSVPSTSHHVYTGHNHHSLMDIHSSHGGHHSSFVSGQHLIQTHHNHNQTSETSRRPHIKKPLNAFMLFMKEMRSKVVSECTLKESAAINQILGRKWHSLNREEQNKYYEMARKEKELHHQLYPGWSARDNYACHAKRKKKRKTAMGALNGEHDNKGSLCPSAKKCRAIYGLDRQDQWCKPCRRKKKCIKFLSDSEDNSGNTSASLLSVSNAATLNNSVPGIKLESMIDSTTHENEDEEEEDDDYIEEDEDDDFEEFYDEAIMKEDADAAATLAAAGHSPTIPCHR